MVDSNTIPIFISLTKTYKQMNQIGEEISMKEAVCRDIYLPDLMSLLRSDIMKYFSWGTNDLTVDKETSPQMLRFKVNGHHHKGHVYIFLNGLDLFDAYLTTSKGVIKQRTEEMGVYFDELVEWIDEGGQGFTFFMLRTRDGRRTRMFLREESQIARFRHNRHTSCELNC